MTWGILVPQLRIRVPLYPELEVHSLKHWTFREFPKNKLLAPYLNPSANAGDIKDTGSIPGWGRPPGEGHGNPLWCSYLENPKDRGAWWATVHRVAKSRTRLKRVTMYMHMSCIHTKLTNHRWTAWPSITKEHTCVNITQNNKQKTMNPQPLSCFLSTFLALTFPDVTTLLKFNITDWFWLLTLCKRFHSVYIHLCLISLTQYDLCELMRSSTAVTFHWCVFFMLIVNFCKWILMWSHHTRSKLCAFYQSFLSRKGNFLPFSQFLVYLCMLFS